MKWCAFVCGWILSFPWKEPHSPFLSTKLTSGCCHVLAGQGCPWAWVQHLLWDAIHKGGEFFSLVNNYIDVSLVLCQLKHSGLILFWARRFPSFNPICNIWSQFWHLAILFGLVIHPRFSRRGKISSKRFFIIQFCSASWPLKRLLHSLARLEDVVASLSGLGEQNWKTLRFPCPASPSPSVSPVRRKWSIYL